MAKKAQAAANEVSNGSALSRVYMDVDTALHHRAKMVALSQGLSLKGWLEKAMLDAVESFEKAHKSPTGKGKK